MKSNKAIKVRLYPNTEQEIMFAKTFGCCRKVWNLMLSDKIEYYKEHKEKLVTTPAMYKKDYEYLKEVDSLALANVQLNLQTAYNNFFRDKRVGFPKYKSKHRSKKSYTTNNQKGSVSIVDNKHIRLPKIGIVKAVVHKLPEKDWILKSATVSQDSDGKYYCSLLFEFTRPDISIQIETITDNEAIGLDYKSDGLYMDSNGDKPDYDKYYRKSQKKLAKVQRRLSKKIGNKKGEKKSNNYRKQQQKVNKIYCKIKHQRKDTLHKLSNSIAKNYKVVCVEDLNMKSLSNKGFGNGKTTMDNAYGMFLVFLEYKLSDNGGYLVKVDKFFPSSQLCHNCGRIHPEMKDLSERVIVCDCGYTEDRDKNSADNIKDEGLRILRLEILDNVG